MLQVEQSHRDAKDAVEARLERWHPFIWKNLCGISVSILNEGDSDEIGVRIDLHSPEKPRSLDRIIHRALGKAGLSDVPVEVNTDVPYAVFH